MDAADYDAHVRDRLQPAREVAEAWRGWCGDTAWTRAMDDFGALGGLVRWWCGYPRSRSAIPLTFSLHRPDGSSIPGSYRLKDIRAAVAVLE